jgi:hypothetical protein
MPEPIYRVYMQEAAPSPSQQIEPPEPRVLEAADTAADKRLEIQVETERAAEGPDLLDESAPQE